MSVYQLVQAQIHKIVARFPSENPFLMWCRRLIIQIKHPRKLFTVKTHILVKLLPNTKNQTLNNIRGSRFNRIYFMTIELQF